MRDDFEDNLIPFPRGAFEKHHNERAAALDEEPVLRARSVDHCDHDRASVDAGARTVTCRDCEVQLDPIDVLARLAANREHLISRGRALRREVEYLTERVAELKKDEANTKARLKRAKERVQLDLGERHSGRAAG